MRKLVLGFSVVLGVLLIAFFVWRQKAPSYQGQDLHVTLPAQTQLEVLILGDTGTGDKEQEKIAEAMNTYCQTHPLAAVVFLGDNFYPHGVKSVDDEQWQTKFMKPYSLDCLKKLPFYALLGNHDYKGNPDAQIERRSESPAWIMPHRFFDVRLGKLLTLTMLDTNILDFCGFSTYCTLDFMRKSLSESTTTFKVVLGHHPVVSSSTKYPRKFQGNVFERLLCGSAHYYIAGHSHHLEHLTSGTCASPLDLFVVGGGGADLYEIKTWQKETRYAESVHGFMSLKVDEDAMTFAFHDNQLKKLYEVVKRKSEESAHADIPPMN